MTKAHLITVTQLQCGPRGTGMSAAGVPLTHSSVPQPLRVIDPDHPLAALVRKAKQEKNGSAAAPAPPPAPEEGAQPSVPTQAEYTADRELSFFRTSIHTVGA